MPDGSTTYTLVGKKNQSTETVSPDTGSPDPINNPDAPFTTVYQKVCGIEGAVDETGPGTGTGSIQVYDEGNIVARTANSFDFVGQQVQATSPDDINVTVNVIDQPVRREGVQQTPHMASLNFSGGGVGVSADGAGNVTITIPANALQSWNGRTGVVVPQAGDYYLDSNNDSIHGAGLGDVIVTAPQVGEALVYTGASTWRNQVVGGVGNHDLDFHDDVTITSPQNGQILIFNSANQQWENQNDPAVNIFLTDLLDVNIPVTPADGEVLTFDTGTGLWGAEPAQQLSPQPINWLTDVQTSAPADGQILVYEDTTGEWINTNVDDLPSNQFRQCQLVENGTNTPATFDGVKTLFGIRSWDDVTEPVAVFNDVPENAILGLEGLIQHARLHYSVSGSSITFITPPPPDALYDLRVLWRAPVVAPATNFLLLGDGSNLLLGDGTSKLRIGSTI